MGVLSAYARQSLAQVACKAHVGTGVTFCVWHGKNKGRKLRGVSFTIGSWSGSPTGHSNSVNNLFEGGGYKTTKKRRGIAHSISKAVLGPMQ